jgi:uncharacterized protein
MYQASTPRFASMLRNLSALIDKAEVHCATKKIEPAALTTYRLYPDMFPFTRQIQIACDTAKGAVARLAGTEIPKYEDTEQTLPELKARIAKTLDFIESVSAAKIDGSEDREIVLAMRSGERRFKGMQYLLGHAYPNFYFHVTTAYVILRHNGVDVGKGDFIGKP